MPTDLATPTSDLPRLQFGRGARRALFAVAALSLLAAANLFAAAYVSAEHYIYFWDGSQYWQKFGLLGDLLRADLTNALAYIVWSIGNENYGILPMLPLIPFEWSFGSGRHSYVLAITNLALVPSAALMAWIVERADQHRSWARYLICTLAVLCLHILWAPALRGLPDVLGVVIASAVLLVYFGKPLEDQRLLRIVGIGLLLCLLVLTRRWYAFWAVSFFPAAVAAYLLASPRDGASWRSLWTVSRPLAIAGFTCLVCLVSLAMPLVVRMATTNHASAYAAYRTDLAGAGPAGQLVAHFGLALLVLCAGGLAALMARPATRQLGLLLLVQALLALALFSSVQGLFAVQHFYLLAPAAGVAIAAAISFAWNARFRLVLRIAAIAGVFAVVLASSVAALSPSGLAAAPFLPRARFAPLARPDLGEIERLMSALAALEPGQIYVAASSEVLNWSIFRVACRSEHPGLCRRIAVTADIDARDGFPRPVLEADYVVLGTPTQYHVRPDDQQVVGLVADQIRERRGIGRSFERLPPTFTLWRGVEATIHRRVGPLRDEDVAALSDTLKRRYPQLEQRFEP